MGFSRALVPSAVPEPDALTAAMVGIGMNFAARGIAGANIEDTIVFASVEGMDREDLRVLSVLVTWFGVHAARVNADRLTRLVAAQESDRVRAFWSALAESQGNDRRFRRLGMLYRGPRIDVPSAGAEFQVRRHGEDPRFEGTSLRIPGNVLRDRKADVLSPTDLAKRHPAYRHRVQMGPTYRSDMWAALEAEPDLSAAELARRTYGSFATAWHVKRDFAVVSSALAHRR